ncbi:MAG: ABC transporter ATP-binding protein [Desulfobulbaceae bacterium A2]|nr:MAG: ABC transporter ATP-binding protein [Desulfobulbaceae bacterium A2]
MPADTPPLIEVLDLHKSYGDGDSRIEILRGVSLTVQPGEMTAVVGASGSGKTTLLQVLGTLDLPSAGQVFFEGRDLTSLTDVELSQLRNERIGFIFQLHHLLPEFTALENVLMPGLIAGRPRRKLHEAARELLERVGLTRRCQHRPGELSGGERQRVALARALIMGPSLLLADEPTGNLDYASGQQVFALLQELSSSLGLATVMVTHNLELAGRMHRILTLREGRLLEA